MYMTIALFGASYEDGVFIDSCITRKWDTQHNVYNLLQIVDPENRAQLIESMPPDDLKVANEMMHALKGMELRARVNGPRLRPPRVFTTDEPPTDDVLIAWAKTNLFKKENQPCLSK